MTRGKTMGVLILNALLAVVFEVSATLVLVGTGRVAQLMNQLYWTMPLVGAMFYQLMLIWNLAENLHRTSRTAEFELDDEDGWFSRMPSAGCVFLCLFATLFRLENAVLLVPALLCMGTTFAIFGIPDLETLKACAVQPLGPPLLQPGASPVRAPKARLTAAPSFAV